MASIIDVYTFISIFIIIGWLITVCMILIYSWIYLPKMYKIESYIQIIQYFLLYLFVFIMIILLFYLRYLRIGYVLNVSEVFGFIVKQLSLVAPQDLIILGLLLSILILVFILAVMRFYAKLKANAFVLFTYYYQYEKFRRFCSKIVRISGDFSFFMLNRVILFTNKPKILGLVAAIWPRGLLRLEKLLVICLLPSLLIYDLLFHNAMVEKVFIVFPWFFLYSILRSVYTLFRSLNRNKNVNLTDKLYGIKY